MEKSKPMTNSIGMYQSTPDPNLARPIQPQFMYSLNMLYNTSNLVTGVKEAYSQKFSSIVILFASFYVFVAIIAFIIINGVVNAFDLNSASDDELIQSFIDLAIVSSAGLIVQWLQFMPSTFLYRMIDNLETNRVEDINQTAKYCISKWPKYILFGFFNFSLFTATVLVIVVVFLISFGLGFLVILPALLTFAYISLRFVSAPAYIMIDEMGIVEALTASWNRMHGRLINYFAASIFISIIGGIIGSMVQIPITLVIGEQGLIGLFIIGAFGHIFLGPLRSLLIMSVYYLTKISLGEVQSSRMFGKMLFQYETSFKPRFNQI